MAKRAALLAASYSSSFCTYDHRHLERCAHHVQREPALVREARVLRRLRLEDAEHQVLRVCLQSGDAPLLVHHRQVRRVAKPEYTEVRRWGGRSLGQCAKAKCRGRAGAGVVRGAPLRLDLCDAGDGAHRHEVNVCAGVGLALAAALLLGRQPSLLAPAVIAAADVPRAKAGRPPDRTHP